MFIPKFDVELLSSEQRMYVALKDLCRAYEEMCEDSQAPQWEPLKEAEKVIALFDTGLGPIPEWAVSPNFGSQFIVGAQLFTTCGRRSGNGWIVQIREEALSVPRSYYVLTDAGSFMQLSQRELERAFEAGDWICSPERIIKDFDRYNNFSNPPGEVESA